MKPHIMTVHEGINEVKNRNATDEKFHLLQQKFQAKESLNKHREKVHEGKAKTMHYLCSKFHTHNLFVHGSNWQDSYRSCAQGGNTLLYESCQFDPWTNKLWVWISSLAVHKKKKGFECEICNQTLHTYVFSFSWYE